MKALAKMIAVIVLVVATPLAYLLLFPITKKRDTLGRTPAAVAELFLSRVQKHDFEGALELWNADAEENFLKNSGQTFEEYCLDTYYYTEFEVSRVYTGKTGWVFAEFAGQVDVIDRERPLSMKLVDGRWTLIEDLRIPAYIR